jgi:hypothetical protein
MIYCRDWVEFKPRELWVICFKKLLSKTIKSSKRMCQLDLGRENFEQFEAVAPTKAEPILSLTPSAIVKRRERFARNRKLRNKQLGFILLHYFDAKKTTWIGFFSAKIDEFFFVAVSQVLGD